MTISGVVQLSGRLRYAAPVPNIDSSSNPTQLSDLLESMTCSGVEGGVYTLTADGDVAVSLGTLPGISALTIKVSPNVGIPPSPGLPNGIPAAPNPVTVKLTGGVGSAQAITVDGFMFLMSASIPYTAISLARATGVQTVVRVQLFASDSLGLTVST